MNSGDCWWNAWARACLRGEDKGKQWGRDRGNGNTTWTKSAQTFCAQPAQEGDKAETHFLNSPDLFFFSLSPFVCSKWRPISIQTSPSPPLLVLSALDQPKTSRGAYCLNTTEFTPACLSSSHWRAAEGAAWGRNTCKEPQLQWELLS